MSSPTAVRRIGLVVHPVRELGRALAAAEVWAQQHGVELVQLQTPGQTRRVAEIGDVSDCDLIVAMGGDGTVLAAIRAGGVARRPVLGVACGSVGALTSVPASDLPAALGRFASGHWTPRTLPALGVRSPGGEERLAYNDLAVVRDGAGQVSVTVHLDDELYGAFAGDGVIVSTQLGSSAYGLAAGGPLLAPGSEAFVLTPLAPHGGSLPPLVLGGSSRLRIDGDPGHVGARVELDGQATRDAHLQLELGLRPAQAVLVSLGDEEPFLAGLRRRRILMDSPRMYVREQRMGAAGPPPQH